MNSKSGLTLTVSKVEQPKGAENDFISNESEDFTRPGIENLNDTVWTYVWVFVRAQAQTRTNILGVGTAFDAQMQFVVNVEDAMFWHVELPPAIKRYQDVLQHAGSKVGYVFGTGLNMAPSNTELMIGQEIG